MTDVPRVHAYCHCEDCRALLDVPYHSIVAWEPDNVSITSGQEHTVRARTDPTFDEVKVNGKTKTD